MTQDAERPRRKGRWWKWTLGILAGFILLVIGLAWWSNVTGRRLLDQALREARADGNQLTFAELQAARRVWPDDQNGTLVIVGIAEQLEALKEDPALKPLPIVGDPDLPFGHHWPADMRDATAEQIQRLRPIMDQIDRLAGKEGGRFVLETRLDAVMRCLPYPHYRQLRMAAKLKCLEAELRVEQGDITHVAQDMDIMRRCGLLLADEPLLISALVRFAIDALAARDCAFGIHHLNKMVDAAGDVQKGAAVSAGLEADLRQKGWYMTFSSMFSPSLERSFALDLRGLAEIRAARVAVALERCRLATSRYPASLDSLVPGYLDQVPVDPFTNEPLRYHVSEKALVIYSVGEDRRDDGGDLSILHVFEGKADRADPIKDTGFVLLKPEFRGQPPVAVTTAAP